MDFRVRGNLEIDKVTYRAGDRVTLPEERAEPLIKLRLLARLPDDPAPKPETEEVAATIAAPVRSRRRRTKG